MAYQSDCGYLPYSIHFSEFIRKKIHEKTDKTRKHSEVSADGYSARKTFKILRTLTLTLTLTTFTLEQMFPDSSHSGYLDSQGVYTTEDFGFVGIQIQCFHLKFRIQNFPDSRFVCKRQNESGTFRIRDLLWCKRGLREL